VVADLGPWRLAARRSALAQAQAREVAAALSEATGRPAELVALSTSGDDHPDRAVESFDTRGVFVDGTRRAVLEGDCHAVVHSHKDLPTEPEPGLVVGAVPQRADPRDALVTRDGSRLADLSRDRPVTVGTSSPRRRAQLLRARRDLVVQPLRGNLGTRLGHVADGALDAVVVAVAGVLRSVSDQVGKGLTVLPLEHGEMLHAPGQGALAVECRADDHDTLDALALIDDGDSRTTVTAERELLLQLRGGCTAPIGAHATLLPGPAGRRRLELLGVLSDPSGTRLYRASHETSADEPVLLGRVLAATLLEAGGREVLDDLEAAR